MTVPLLAALSTSLAVASDSLHVRTVGTWSLGGSQAVACCRIGGRAHALAGSGGRLVVLDITDPSSPQARGDLSLIGSILDVSVSGTTAFLAMGDRVVAVDVSSPERPALMGSLGIADSVARVSAGGGRLYLAAGASGVIVANAADPAHLSVAGVCATPERAVDVASDGATAYCLDDSAGLLKIDASNPAAPYIKSQCPVPDSATALEIAGRTAYALSRRGTWSSTITSVDMDSMSGARSIQVPGRLEDLSYSNGYLLAAAGDSGVHVYDVREPSDLGEAGYCRTQGAALRAATLDSVAAVGDTRGIMTLDLTGLRHLSIAGSAGQGGNITDLAISGSIAYAADASYGLRVYDIADPANPANIAGVATPGQPSQLVLAGNRLYLADGTAGVRVFDISDPANPVMLGSFDTPGTANGLAVAGNRAFVADGDSGLTVVNFSDPANPSLHLRHNIAGFSAEKCLVKYYLPTLNKVYLTGPGAILVTLTIIQTNVIEYDRYTDFISGHWMQMMDGYVLVMNDDVLCALQPATTRNPTFLRYAIGIPSGSGRAFALRDSFLLTADGESGFQAMNIANIRVAVFGAGHCATPGYARSVVLSGDYAWIADGAGGLLSVDVSSLSKVKQAGRYQMPLSIYGLSWNGDRLYFCDPNTGLRVLDASDPALPREVGYCPLPGPAFGLAEEQDRVFVANGSWGLVSVDVSDPSFPSVAGAYDTAGFFYAVCARDSLVLAAADSSGLLVLDATDPAQPRMVGQYDTPGTALGVSLSGDLALVADGASGLQLVDVSDPVRPVLRSSFPSLDCSNASVPYGRYALVADGRTGLLVVDIGNPGAPVLVSQLPTGGYARHLWVGDSICYVACSDSGLAAVNLADPARPERVGWYRTGNSVWSVAGSGPYLAMSDDDALVRIIRGYDMGREPPPDPGSPLKVSPNPFSGRARIDLNLGEEAQVRVAVYNILGQQVATLFDGTLSAAPHTFYWTICEGKIAGGVYFLRVRVGNRNLTARMALVK